MKITIRSASEVVFETTTTWTLGQLVGKVASRYLDGKLYPTKRESNALELTVSCLHKYVITVDALDARYITFQEKKWRLFKMSKLGHDTPTWWSLFDLEKKNLSRHISLSMGNKFIYKSHNYTAMIRMHSVVPRSIFGKSAFTQFLTENRVERLFDFWPEPLWIPMISYMWIVCI
jgi:hypothetical protein